MSFKEYIKDLKQEIQRVYLFYGEEFYLVESALDKIKKILIIPEMEELNLAVIDGKEITIEKLIDACETLPFMSEKKLVLIRNLETLFGKKDILSENDQTKLVNYLKEIPQTTCLIFYGYGSIDARRKIVKEIKKQGKVYCFDKLKEDELKKWIEKTFKQYGKEISPKQLSNFIFNTNYIGKDASQNLLDIKNQIHKIASYMGDLTIVEEKHIINIGTLQFQNNIFELLDAIGENNTKKALTQLNNMIIEGEPILRILSTMANQMKNIFKIKFFLEQGYDSKMIASKISIHPYLASKCTTQGKRFSLERIKFLLNVFLETDLMIKTGRQDAQISMQLLIMEICKK